MQADDVVEVDEHKDVVDDVIVTPLTVGPTDANMFMSCTAGCQSWASLLRLELSVRHRSCVEH